MAKINFKILKEEVQKDLSWSMVNCAEVCLKIPSIKTKYCAILYDLELEVKASEMTCSAVYKTLHESYLSGNKTAVLIDRRDVHMYITGDPDYLKVFAGAELAKANAKFIEGVLKSIDSMSFSINSAVRWEIYQNGG